MAKELNDAEFWLPPEFLTDDDILMDYKSTTTNKVPDSAGYIPFDFSCSGLTSPEVESDEEDYLAGWTRKTAQIKLNDMIWKSDTNKVSAMAGSPQSTLCKFLGGCGCKSPNCPSRVSSPSPPPAAKANRSDGDQDLLASAAGKVARLRTFEDMNGYYQNVAPSCTGFYPNESLSYNQIQVAQFQQLNHHHQQQQQQMLNQQALTNRYHQSDKVMNNNNRLLGLPPSAWPTLQQSQQQPPPSSVMRAIFVGNNGVKRERAGTGVFLPRQVSTPAEIRRKPSSILLPDQVFKALNLNVYENINVQSQFPSRPANDYSLKNPHQASAAARSSHHEIQLPQEWTY
ncbi:uncharacterized protein LOC124936205 [Impatiens glandulifera]|uniref:uncharacterized protein LOC124936205 n=1 Tax=Impatiens glandulifera TaxID=253017 RepID=UPI001FB18B55|nr:uncharacterized protein LOC124936205 [Impatiens glandulifera]